MKAAKLRYQILVAIVAWCCRPLDAEGQIAIEAYSKVRAANVGAAVERLHGYLQHYGVVAGAKPAKEMILRHINVAKPAIIDSTLTYLRLIERIELGTTTFLKGTERQLPTAQKYLENAISEARANPAIVISDERGREAMTRAYVHLALCRLRLKDRRGALAAMAEQARSYPEFPVTRSKFGTEAMELFSDALRDLALQKSGILEIKVTNSDAQIFVNEFVRGERGTFREQRLPGGYRIVVQVGAKSLRFDMVVESDKTALLEVDWALELALTVSDEWVGIILTSDDPDAEELAFVRALSGKMQGADSFVMLNALVVERGLRITATLYRGGLSMALIRRGEILLGDSIEEPKLDALAKFVAKGEASRHVVEVTPRVESPPLLTRSKELAPPSLHKRSQDRLAYRLLIGGGALAVVTGGVTFLLDEDQRASGGRTYRDTAPLGIGIATAGVVSIGVGLWLWRRSPTLAIAPSAAVVGWAGSF